MRLEFSIDIQRPLPDVFAVVSNLANDPLWQAAVVQTKQLTTGPVQAGTRFRHLLKVLGRQAALDIEFVSYRSLERYLLQCAWGPLVFGTEVYFESIPRATRVTTRVEGHPKGVARMVAVTLSNHRRVEIEADLRNLKHMMEAGAL